MTEKHLIEKCIKKDQKAMTELFYRYANVLKTTCRRLLKDEDEAADAFQEGFIQVFNKLDTFQFKSSIYTWMNRIMVNTSLNYLRKKNIIYGAMDITEMDMVEESVEMQEETYDYLEELDSSDILDLLNELPEKYRIALALFAIDGLKHVEISEKLGISVVLSKKLVSRARIKLLEIVKIKQYEHRETGYSAAK